MENKLTIVLDGEFTDLNTYVNRERTNRFAGASLKKEETNRVAWQVKKHKDIKFEYPVWIDLKWYCKDKRKDKDNIAFAKKFIFDGLVVGGVLHDDRWSHIKGFTDTFFVDKENPRVEITIHNAN